MANAKWYWKGDNGWVEYDNEASERLEKAFKKGQKTCVINETYKADFKQMIQHRKDDYNRQRAIKREESGKRAKEEEEEDLPPQKKQKQEDTKEGKQEDVNSRSKIGSKRLQRDYKITKEAEAAGNAFKVELLNDDLYRWEIKLFEFDSASQLAKDLQAYKKKHGEDYVTLRFYFPQDYPLTAPLVHVVSPKLVGPYIFNGGLCMSILMQGWAPGITPESLLLQVRQLFMEGNVRINNINKKEWYTEEEARAGFNSVKQAHQHDKSFE